MQTNPKFSIRYTPFFTLFKREVRRFMKVFFQTVASPLINTLLYLLIFGISVGQYIEPVPGVSYITFILPGLVMMATLRNSFDNASGSIITSKFVGELESLKMSPLSSTQMTWAFSFGSLIRGIFVGIITLIVGIAFEWMMTDNLVTIKHPFWMLFFMITGGLSLGNLGLATAILSKNIEQVAAFSTFILLPLIYLGGVFFSLDSLHHNWRVIAEFNPLLYLVSGLRYSMIEVSEFSLQSITIAAIIFTICSHLIAILSIRWGSFKRW